MYLLNVIENYIEVKKFNYMLEIDILRNPSKRFGCPKGMIFEGLDVQTIPRHPAG